MTLLLSLTAGRRNRPASKHRAGNTNHASDRPAAAEGASFTKPVPSNEGSERPSQLLQQRPRGSRHAPAGTSKQEMVQRSTGRLPGMKAPTSENYTPDSHDYLALQVFWRLCNFADEATFRVYVAIGMVFQAAAESAEHLKHSVEKVHVLLTSQSVRSETCESHGVCVTQT